MIIFLDDSAIRRKAFRSYFPSTEFAETVPEVIALIERSIKNAEEIEYLFLDHDLGGEEYVHSLRNDTGMEVVRWIIKYGPPIREVVVHTCNNVAGWEMLRQLRLAGYNASYVPYTQFKEKIYREHG